jgi:hypothetical protein
MMKKLICASLLVLISAGTSFAGATAATVGMSAPKGYTPSNNVKFGYESGVNTVGVNDRYSIATKHTSGDRVYGTVSASGVIYSSLSGTGIGNTLQTSDIPTLPSTSTDSTVTGGAGGWTAM